MINKFETKNQLLDIVILLYYFSILCNWIIM